MRSGAISSSALMVIAMSTGWRVYGLSAPRPTLMPSTCDATAVLYVTASRSKYESWNHTDSRPSSRARRAHSTVSATSPRAASPRPTRRARLDTSWSLPHDLQRARDPRERPFATEQLQRLEQRQANWDARDCHADCVGEIPNVPPQIVGELAQRGLDPGGRPGRDAAQCRGALGERERGRTGVLLLRQQHRRVERQVVGEQKAQ